VDLIPIQHTTELVALVREHMRLVGAGSKTADEIREWFRTSLTPQQISVTILELMKESDMHEIICLHFEKEHACAIARARVTGWELYAQSMIKDLFDVENQASYILARGAVAQLFDTTFTAFANVSKTCMTSNILVFLMFSMIEIHKWSTNSITNNQLMVNIGEHFAGGVASYGGELIGFCVGLSFGPIGMLICQLLFGTFFGFIGRGAVRGLVNNWVNQNTNNSLQAYLQVVREVALKMEVNIDAHSYSEAKMRFRGKIQLCHPDKFRNASEEIRNQKNREATELIAGWNIVRKYYEDNNKLDTNLPPEDADVFIKVYALRVYDKVRRVWVVVRTFFEELQFEEREGVDMQEIQMYM
jgi:hypothetical protein